MSEIRVNSIVAEGGTSAPVLTYGAQFPTGMGITGAGGINVTGVVTATSFSGSGSGLTGVGTDNVNTNNLKLSGITTLGTTSTIVGSAVTFDASGGTIVGVLTATTFVGALTGNVTGNASGTAGGLTGTPNISVVNVTSTGDVTIGGGLTVTGNMTVDGTQTIINTTTLDVADKTVGLGSTTAATNTTAAGAGIEIYASSATANNNKTILWQNTSNCFEFSESVKLKGVSETSINSGSTGVQTYINGTSLVLELDMEAGSVFNYTTPAVAAASDAAGVGIVSFKNMPANAQNVRTVTVIFTGGKATGGMGNTSATAGIGVTCRVIPKSGGSAVAGIMTRGFCSGGIGAASTVTLTADGGTAGNVSGNVDIVSFLVHYTGGTNTDLNSYKIYVTKNGGYNQGSVGV